MTFAEISAAGAADPSLDELNETVADSTHANARAVVVERRVAVKGNPIADELGTDRCAAAGGAAIERDILAGKIDRARDVLGRST